MYKQRDWLPDLPRISYAEYTDSPYLGVDFKVQMLERKCTNHYDMDIAFNPLFGNLMFLSREIQISEYDYDAYHDHVIKHADFGCSNVIGKPRMLVIGDGDGGFTMPKYKWIDIEIVEREEDVAKAGEKWFGADWTNVSLTISAVEDFEPALANYDAISMAVDAGFNNGPLEYQIDRLWKWLKPGGRLIGQASTTFDPAFVKTRAIYEKWAMRHSVDYYWSQVYIGCYFGMQNFFVGVK